MTLLSAILKAYRSITKKQFLLWSMFYLVVWVLLSITTLNDNGQDTNGVWQTWIDQFAIVYGFALLSPVLSAICQRWSIESHKLFISGMKLIVFYLPFKTCYAVIMLLVKYPLYWLIFGVEFTTESAEYIFIYKFIDGSPIYVAAIFIIYTKIYFEIAQREQVNAVKLEGELQQVRMEVLRNQLQPHFLFNTLNLISSTMYQDVDKADSIITRLGDLLRYSLTTEQKPLMPLREEMQVMMSYLEISELRFGDRMSIKVEIAPQTETILIPAMLLQPLLENAVKFGIEPADEKGEISVITSLENEQLFIKISNPAYQHKVQQQSFGIGLQNTRNRLDLLYKGKASITLDTEVAGIVTLIISLPIKPMVKISD
jgi:two-component system, LytTR family, sensor kinase